VLNSPKAYSVNAPICKHHQTVHFVYTQYIGGIVEFMSQDFLKQYHPTLYYAGVPPGNLSSIDWSKMPSGSIESLKCLPMSTILRYTKKHHINYFVLDVEVRLIKK
jgi:hypothetical protein